VFFLYSLCFHPNYDSRYQVREKTPKKPEVCRDRAAYFKSTGNKLGEVLAQVYHMATLEDHPMNRWQSP
jgi:hypothetical protein